MTVQNQNIKKSTLTETVMEEIRQRISRRRLTQGTRLPSIRQFAETMKVSTSTVVNAYDRLAAEGIIQPRKGSGYYVVGSLSPLNLGKVGPRVDRDIDPLWVSRQSLEAGEGVLKPGCGWLPSSWMPQTSIRKALRTMARSSTQALTEYGSPHGFAPLREHLARKMLTLQIPAQMEQVILTGSGTQSIDLLCRFFVKSNDTVLVDDPCYFNFHALLKAHGVKVVGVPYRENGPDLELFERALIEHAPKLYITNSAIQNPTGATLSPVVAHNLLKLAEQFNLVVIEDDIFADFENEPAPRLAAMDGLNRVVHMGSFSKTLSASARCGFIAARADWIEGLIDLKIATTFGGDPFSAELAWLVLKDGSYRKHLLELRARLSQAMGTTCSQLSEIGIEPWIIPLAGMYVWGKLPQDVCATDVARKALEDNIVLAPGNVFSLSKSGGQYLRFNVAQSQEAQIYETLKRVIY